MIRFALGALLLCPVFAADVSLRELLDSVETRYNRAKTLQVSFEESFSGPGRPKRTESGLLTLRKPGRMRWEYRNPAGKLFLSDGKHIYYYSPASNRAERMKLKESDDLRAPLAFLLGRLDFEKDFKTFQSRPDGADTVIQATPKSDKLPYKAVEFSVTPAAEIRRLIVTGHDNSLLTFNFANERVNPSVDDKLFRFEPPPGATWVDSAGDTQ